MRHIFIIAISLLCCSVAQAQISADYAISSLGGASSTPVGEVAYTAGELALVTTVGNGGYTLTQGFLQRPPNGPWWPGGNLPVTLLDFTGTGGAGVNHLLWHTASEINNDRFEIERADASVQFKKIGEVKGAGSSNEKLTYTFDDLHPLAGVNYYRLKQVDFDGQATYSEIIEITIGSDYGMSISVFPNPVHDQMSVVINMDQTQNGQLMISDILGHTVYTQDILIGKGNTLIYIPLSDFAAGQYILTCTTGSTRSVVKVTRQ